MSLRFHWSMSSAGDSHRGAKDRARLQAIPDFDALVRFCRQAEECGIESLLTAIGFHRADPIALASALGMLTTRIKFMVAVRSGLICPTAYVQQVNTVAALTNGRICLNIVAGHTPAEQAAYGDFLPHDERYARTDEFLAVCNALWHGDTPVSYDGKYFRIENAKLNLPFVNDEGRRAPEIFIAGASAQAAELTIRHGQCLWILPDRTEKLRAHIAPLLAAGVEAGLLVSLRVRPTREEAIRSAREMLESLGTNPLETHDRFKKKSDSVAWRTAYELASGEEWITNTLWTGAVPYMGAPAIALVGSPDDVASAILDYRDIGITQFLFMGWPDDQEMTIFARDVLPIVRRREQELYMAGSVA